MTSTCIRKFNVYLYRIFISEVSIYEKGNIWPYLQETNSCHLFGTLLLPSITSQISEALHVSTFYHSLPPPTLLTSPLLSISTSLWPLSLSYPFLSSCFLLLLPLCVSPCALCVPNYPVCIIGRYWKSWLNERAEVTEESLTNEESSTVVILQLVSAESTNQKKTVITHLLRSNLSAFQRGEVSGWMTNKRA